MSGNMNFHKASLASFLMTESPDRNWAVGVYTPWGNFISFFIPSVLSRLLIIPYSVCCVHRLLAAYPTSSMERGNFSADLSVRRVMNET